MCLWWFSTRQWSCPNIVEHCKQRPFPTSAELDKIIWWSVFLSTRPDLFLAPCANPLQVQSRRLLAELLLQTSRLRPNDQVVLVAATNRLGEHVCEHSARNTNCFMTSLLDSLYTYRNNLLVEHG